MLNADEFVDNLRSNQHILHLITDPNKGQNIQFKFLQDGLLKNEYCIYLTHEDPDKIKHRMQKFGIDVDKFVKSNMLHVHKIPDLLKHPYGSLRGFQDFFDKIMPKSKPKFRLVGRAINDITTQEGWNAEMEIEQLVHSTFDSINGMVLCYYDSIQKLEHGHATSHVKQLFDCHHGVIFSTITGPSFAGNLN